MTKPYSAQGEEKPGRLTYSTASPAVQSMHRHMTATRREGQLMRRSSKRFTLAEGVAEVVGIPTVDNDGVTASVHDAMQGIEDYLRNRDINVAVPLERQLAIGITEAIRDSALQARALEELSGDQATGVAA